MVNQRDQADELTVDQVQSPRTVGQYKLLREIGRGGMGMVYAAQHTQLDRVVALKLLPPKHTNDARAVERFQREMKAVGHLDHHNIVAATDGGEHGSTHYLVMELVEGVDVARAVKRLGPLPIDDACEVIRQAAIGLQHAHQNGLVHRDIKPSNLMLTNNGVVKILDMGLARLRSDEPEQGELTDTGEIMGSVDYMAPEQAISTRDVDIRADIYSLGCTLYHLLSGRPPFHGPRYNNPLKKIMAHARRRPQSIRRRRRDVPEEVEAILDQMLAKDPDDRFAEPADVAAAISPFCEANKLATRAAVAIQTPDPPTGSESTLHTLTMAAATMVKSPLWRMQDLQDQESGFLPFLLRKRFSVASSITMVLVVIGITVAALVMSGARTDAGGSSRIKQPSLSVPLAPVVTTDPTKAQVRIEVDGESRVVALPLANLPDGLHVVPVVLDGEKTDKAVYVKVDTSGSRWIWDKTLDDLTVTIFHNHSFRVCDDWIEKGYAFTKALGYQVGVMDPATDQETQFLYRTPVNTSDFRGFQRAWLFPKKAVSIDPEARTLFSAKVYLTKYEPKHGTICMGLYDPVRQTLQRLVVNPELDLEGNLLEPGANPELAGDLRGFDAFPIDLYTGDQQIFRGQENTQVNKTTLVSGLPLNRWIELAMVKPARGEVIAGVVADGATLFVSWDGELLYQGYEDGARKPYTQSVVPGAVYELAVSITGVEKGAMIKDLQIEHVGNQ